MDNELRNSEDFIKGKTSSDGFSVPQDYFDSIEDGFSAKLREEALPKQHGLSLIHIYPDETFTFGEDHILSTSKNSAFIGKQLQGSVYGIYANNQLVRN